MLELAIIFICIAACAGVCLLAVALDVMFRVLRDLW